MPGTFDLRFFKEGLVDTIIANAIVNASDTATVDLLIGQPTGACFYRPGDINGNGVANGIDVTYAVSYFKGGPPPARDCGRPIGPCPQLSPFYAAGDVNGSCVFNGIDITFYVSYLKGGPPTLLFCPDCPPALGPMKMPILENQGRIEVQE
jgi:hypothetical protein